MDVLVTIGFSLICGIIVWNFIRTIVTYKQRYHLGNEILFPKKLTYLSPQSANTLRTTEDTSYRIGIYFYIFSSLFLLYLWFRLVFIDSSTWRMFGLVCWVPLFTMNTFEIREKGLIYNGMIQKWEDVVGYEWKGKPNKRILVLELKRKRLFSKSVQTFALSDEIYEQVDFILKESIDTNSM